MHARVTFAQVRPGELHETIGLLRESLYPAFRLMNGFKGALLLTNSYTEKVGGITLWEGEADVPHVTDIVVETSGRPTRRFFEAGPLEQLSMIPLLGQADREIYEVKIQVVATSAGEPMHARVLTAQVQPGKMDDLISIGQDSVAPILNQQKGFKSYLGLTQGSASKALVITLWEKEADERKWEIDIRYQELVAEIMPLIAGMPTVERYEVSVQA